MGPDNVMIKLNFNVKNQYSEGNAAALYNNIIIGTYVCMYVCTSGHPLAQSCSHASVVVYSFTGMVIVLSLYCIPRQEAEGKI